MEVGLGRLEVPDERDENYLMRSVLPSEAPGINYRYWYPNGWWGDQWRTPKCVVYSWAHWAEDGPFTRTDTPSGTQGGHSQSGWTGQQPIFELDPAYNWCQRNDQWPGEDYDGTSVRAGAKYLQKQLGLIESYRWAWNVEDVVRAILTTGPVVVGTRWHVDMFYPNDEGIIKPTSDVIGGHAYLLNGVNTDRGLFRIKNSWGRDWGKNGYAYIAIEDMARLISEAGEACLPTPK